MDNMQEISGQLKEITQKFDTLISEIQEIKGEVHALKLGERAHNIGKPLSVKKESKPMESAFVPVNYHAPKGTWLATPL